MSTASYAAVQEALERCRRYRKENALYGVVQPALGRIMLEVGPVGAVTMPAVLGHRVRERLAAYGPIIGHPRSARWTFLTGHVDESGQDMSVVAELIGLGAALALPGTRIVLPSPADERTGYRVWIDMPADALRPTFGEVVAITRGCRTH
ncbi:hypothetical protein [Nocardia sp. NPDC051570]|uniref:hypothetical protein n=1 Tax=Nocardia sp. NPDC051570 TaxID=3364324 RepID=UPI0037BA1EC1